MTEPWFGWRARIGVICVDSSRVIEGEFRAMAPEGVAIHATRIHLPSVTIDGLGDMRQSEALEECTRLLTGAGVHSIVYGGTSVSFLPGCRGSDTELIDRMGSIAGAIPCTTTSTAALRALRKIPLQKIAVATPYNDEINGRLRTFFEAAQVEVVSITGQGIEDPWEICEQAPETIYKFVKESDHAGAEGIFVSCADYRVGVVIEALERDLGKPVLGAIQVSFWDAIRLAGVKERIKCFGSFLSEH